MAESSLLLRNRAHGHVVEQWAATTLLPKIHKAVRVVGGQHYPDSCGYDVEADGILYEVKSCMQRVKRRAVGSGSQPGRWKIDTLQHAELAEADAARAMYLLVTCDDVGPFEAYVCSHAVMGDILAQYARQGQYVSVTTSVWTRRLVRIYRRGRRA